MGGLKKSLALMMGITEGNCCECLNPFNDKKNKPLCGVPCQHYFCVQCYESKIKINKYCPICLFKFQKNPIKCNTMELFVMTVNKYQEMNLPSSAAKTIIKEIAKVLFQLRNSCLYYCKCGNEFDREHRQPKIVCQNEHFFCQECIINLKIQGNKCPQCESPCLPSLKVYDLVLQVSDFIHKTLFCVRLEVIIDKDRKYSIVTHGDCLIKEIFIKLQHFQCIPEQIDPRDCTFLIYVEGRGQPIKMDLNDKIEQSQKLEIVFDEMKARSKSSILKASKEPRLLPIKLSSLKSNYKYIDEPQKQLYPSIHSDSKKRQQSILDKLEHHLPQISEYQQKKIFLEKKSSGFVKKQQALVVPIIKNPFSKNEESLIKKSVLRSKRIEEEQNKQKNIRKSKMPEREEMPQGTFIPEEYIINYQTSLPSQQRKQVLQRFIARHQVNSKDEALLCLNFEKVMNKPITEAEIVVHKKLIGQIVKSSKNSIKQKIICLLQNELQSGDLTVFLQPTSSSRSKLSLKIITSHVLSDRFKVVQTVKENQQFYFERLFYSQEQTHMFLQKIKKEYMTRFGLDPEEIVFHRIAKGNLSIVVELSINDGGSFTRLFKNSDKDIEIKPFFKQLFLSPDDFDQKGYIKFNSIKSDIEERGNWPYYQPQSQAVRFGIKVNGQFDNGNDTWLKMKNQKGEWVVAFHAVKHPNRAYKQVYTTIISILSCENEKRQDRKVISEIEGSQQALVDDICVISKKPLGKGVYLSPMFSDCLAEASPLKLQQNEYRLVFQCRLDPKKIHIPLTQSKQQTWVVNDSAGIRPYGIVMIEQKKALEYPRPLEQYKENFRYEKYREKIEKTLK